MNTNASLLYIKFPLKFNFVGRKQSNRMNINLLGKYISESKMNKSDIAKGAGISRTTLDNALNGADMKVSTLESLSKILGVNSAVFFSDSPITTGDNSPAVINGNASVTLNSEQSNPELIVLREKVNSLETLLAEKERMIQFLMERK